jgi:hypothetical protein
VSAVSVEVCAVVPLMVTEVGLRLHVGRLAAPEGEVVTAQVSVTAPVNEFAGVTVMVEVVLAPGTTAMAPLLVRVKLVLPPPPGACQKSPHPARNPADKQTATGAAASANRRAHLPILIAAPLRPPSESVRFWPREFRTQFKGIASPLVLSRFRFLRAHGRTFQMERRTPAGARSYPVQASNSVQASERILAGSRRRNMKSPVYLFFLSPKAYFVGVVNPVPAGDFPQERTQAKQ